MSIDPNNVDLQHVENVKNIKPAPTVAVSASEHHFGSLGHEGKRLLLELLQATNEDEPFEDRVFGRLGIEFSHARWRDYDLYWVEGGAEAMLEALERWNQVHSM